MGRFAEIVQRYGATYVGFDDSYAVDAAYSSTRHLPASISFRPTSFSRRSLMAFPTW